MLPSQQKDQLHKDDKELQSRRKEDGVGEIPPVLGIRRAWNVHSNCLIQRHSEESRTLFRYFENLKPGSVVTIIKPNIEGQLSRGGTPLISTREPLIPTTAAINQITLPPYDVEGSSLEFRFFSFVTKQLKVDSAVIADNVCAGKLCDGQT